MAGRDDASQGREPQTDPPALHVQGEELRGLLASSEKHGVPPVDLTTLRFSLADLDLLPLEIARRHKALPLLAKADALFIAMANPSDAKAREELEFVCGRRLLAFVADHDRLGLLIDRAYEARARGEQHLYGDNVQSRVPPSPALPTGTSPTGRPAMVVASRSRTILSHSGPPSARPPSARPPSGARLPQVAAPVDAALVPSAPATVPPMLPSSAPLAPAPMPPPALSLGTYAVWVVSADAQTRTSLTQTFANLGHTTASFETAFAFRATAAESPPDVVFLDPALRDEDVHELLKHLRAQPRSAQLPVVLLVSSPTSWRRERDLRAAFGAVSTLPMPANEGDLLARFEAVIDPAAAGHAPRPLPPAADDALKASTAAYLRGDVDEAIQHLLHGIEVSPQSYRLHYQVALLHGRQGAVHAAITALERSVALFDGFFPALKNLAVLYERVGFRWCAADVWERALSVAPDEATRRQIKDHLGLVAPTQGP